ncbi:MAG: CoA-binding protein [Nitrospinota bacterium]|nr:CoA-binding protein [Nitrospinota bacterium]
MDEACDISKRPPAPEENPDDEAIAGALGDTKRIAVIGISAKPGRASLDVAHYLRDHGYEIVPVNPMLKQWEGIECYPSLNEIPGPVDIVDIFRKPESIGELVEEIVAKKPKWAWLQLGIVNNEAAAKIREAGINVVQDRCIKIEHARLI